MIFGKHRKRHSVETSSFCKAGVASTPPTLQNRKPYPYRELKTADRDRESADTRCR
jgi:hypothetical protein